MIPVLRGANVPRQQRANNFVSGSFDYESDVDAYFTYADVAGPIPTLGASGATDVTVAYNKTNPLNGFASLDIVKPTGDRQGASIASNFQIGLGDQGGVLRLSFKYAIFSGAFPAGTSSVDSNLTAYIYDVTNAKLIPLSDHKLYSDSSSTALFNAMFQTSIDSIDYKLILFIGTTDTNAWSMKIDNLEISPLQSFTGALITEWAPYTETLGSEWGVGATHNISWRLNGGDLELDGEITEGTTTASEARLPFPSGFGFVSSNESDRPTLGLAGYATVPLGDGTVTMHNGTAILVEKNVTYFTFQKPSVSTLTKADANNLNSGAVLRINARAPLAGKGSSIQAALSGDDGRIILARYTGVVNATASTSAPVQWGTKNYDSHNAVTTGSSWKFVAPISAWYEYSAAFRQTSTNTYAYAYKNGVIYERLRFLATDETSPVTGKIYLKAGDYFDIRTADSVTIAAESECAIAICRIAGNAVAMLANQPKPVASYYCSANKTNSSSTPIDFDTAIHDNRSAVTTGSSWKFTAPERGYYKIGGCHNSASGNGLYIQLYKNGSLFMGFIGYVSADGTTSYNATLLLNQNDYIDLRGSTSNTASGGALTTGPSRIEIEKVSDA